ncbi:T9SS type B sorting domain-containing protein, partial [Tenacibaculum sp. UWU-22]|uniref:T9SS type B sorting domain-containing protein n=1 Tax=Tenacibaculum sp. UWU-22 TaxID=3234187 RepID=UPI0034DB15F1
DDNGVVINNTDGYTTPSSNYTTPAPIALNTPFEDVSFCENSNGTITVDSNADQFQWQQSTDGTNWNNLANNTTYSGVNTKDLEIANTPLTLNNYQYRVILNRTGNSCDYITNAITLTVHEKPTITSPVTLKQCDDDTDAYTYFNLTEANSLISNNSNNETFSYFNSLADAENNKNPIKNDTSYQNKTPSSDTVYARIINANGCYKTATVNLIVSTTKVPSSYKRNFEECDDFLDVNGNNTSNNDNADGITSFDFSSVKSEIESFFSAPGQRITATFYRNQSDALAEENEITNTTKYRNIGYPNTQQIYVRVESDIDNSCLGLGPYVKLTVISVPIAEQVSDLVLCDDDTDGSNTNGFVQNFDLESQTPTVLGNQDPATFQVTYHSSKTDADNGNNPLSSPFTNTIAHQQTIYVRVTNKNTGCYTSNTTFNLIVNPIPIANHVDNLQVCDDDSDGSARNGFAQNINLESQTSGILGSQDAASYTVTYHASLADAQNGTNQLTSPFSNTKPHKQTIYAKIISNKTNCSSNISTFNVLVNPEPLANPDPLNPVSNLSMCDDLTDGDDTNGIVQNFDLDSQIPDILGASQDPDDFIVTFHLSKAEASSGTNSLHSPFTNTIAHQQTIYVRVQNKATGCVNDNFSFLLIVYPIPDFEVTSPQYICLNNTPLTLQVENPDGEYTYQWKDTNGNNLGTDISQNVFEPGKYTVTATTTNGSECSKTKTIIVNQSNIATLTLDDIIVKDGTHSNTISINNNNHNLGEGDYEFSLLYPDETTAVDYQDSPIFENLEGNIYTVLARDKNGCGVARIDVSVMEFPDFFTPNDDGYNDTWQIKGVNASFYPKSEIYIFNRMGKVLSKLSLDSNGWDGTYKNKLVLPDDYWYKITLIDKKGNIHTKTGHFSLIRK